jgi:hypothetical protein
MSDESLPTGPDRNGMIRLIRETWPLAAVATMEGAAFFSLDEKQWPNFATVAWSDDFDEGAPSRLSRPEIYRVNIGLGKESFQRVVGSVVEPDYAVLDVLLPHPVYAKQHWIAILNPSDATVRDTALPLLTEAHDRLVAVRERQRREHRAGTGD